MDRLARSKNKAFDRLASEGIWHHESFNRRTGKFKMVFVNAAEHGSNYHVGGFASWVDWVVDTVRYGKIDKLSPNQLQAFQNGFAYREGTKKCFDKFAKLGIDVSITSDAAGDVSEIIFKKGGKEIGRTGSRIAAGRLIRYARIAGLRVGVRAVPIIFVLGAAGSAAADGGDPMDIAVAAGREMAGADLVESGVQIVVVDSIGNPIARHMYSGDRMRQEFKKYGSSADVKAYNHFWQRHWDRIFGGGDSD